MFAEVLVELKAQAVDKTFTYKIDACMQEAVKVGVRVLVPFGKQKLEGFVLKIKAEKEGDYTVKSILACQDIEPVLNEELLLLGNYISKSTISTQINAYQTMLPTALKAKQKGHTSKKYQSYLFLTEPLDTALQRATPKQKEILYLFEDKEKIEKKEAVSLSASAVSTLLSHHILKEEKEEVYRMQTTVIETYDKNPLTCDQQDVVRAVLDEKKFQPFLLHGITGSGKTEVYMEMIERILEEGKEALVLVPEISLTPQFLSKFKNRFGEGIAVLHSHLSDGEKYDEWRRIERKEARIVVGVRSAVFAPFTNLGIIILDEEHSASYKQENKPKYHATDIALFRARYHKCPLVLGSATPSVESYTRAKAGIYKLLTLNKRVTGALPHVTLVDMKEEIRKGFSVFSRLLTEKIESTIASGNQVLLLLNRRGYATVSTCASCGYTDKCPHCDIPLVFHKKNGLMRCHYCGYAKKEMQICPECQNTHIHAYGMGTQKLEEEIHKTFPQARVLRMDADTTSNKHAYEEIIHAFEEGKYNILVGTQMIAKGLDFDRVALVGVLSADASLNIPDFRSGERTFSLLAQVAGRAGRKTLQSEVVFQGFNMNHYSILAAAHHDYTSFYEAEMHLRKKLGYPPYFNLSSIEIKSKSEELAYKESQKIRSYLDRNTHSVQILGPTAANIAKVNDVYCYKILLKYKKKEELREVLLYIYQMYKTERKVLVETDLNPIQI